MMYGYSVPQQLTMQQANTEAMLRYLYNPKFSGASWADQVAGNPVVVSGGGGGATVNNFNTTVASPTTTSTSAVTDPNIPNYNLYDPSAKKPAKEKNTAVKDQAPPTYHYYNSVTGTYDDRPVYNAHISGVVGGVNLNKVGSMWG